MIRIAGTHPVYWQTNRYLPPEDWKIKKIEECVEYFKGKLPKNLLNQPSEKSLPYLLIDGLINGGYLYTEEIDLPIITEHETVVIADGSRSGMAIRGIHGILGSTLLGFRAKSGYDNNYIYYLLESFYSYTNAATIGGAVPHLDKKLLLQTKLAIPELNEQILIGYILNSVDEVIGKKLKEISDSEALKKSFMYQLFTQGIPREHKNYKSTKIGKIPEDWEVIQIQDILASPLINGVSPQSRPEPPGTPILNVSCIKNGICNPALVTYVDVDEENFKKYQAKQGDFYVLRGNGNRDYVATGGILTTEPDPPCIFSDLLIRLRFKPDFVVDKFIPWMWQSEIFKYRLQSKAKSGSGLWKIGLRDIRRELIARPKPDEQREIVQILDSVQNLIGSLQAELESLQKLKRSLLQNLLTGKVRVNLDGGA